MVRSGARGTGLRVHVLPGRGDYARETAKELDIDDCFKAFLPKPNVIIDDQSPADWRRLVHVHPAEAVSKRAGDYADAVYGVVG